MLQNRPTKTRTILTEDDRKATVERLRSDLRRKFPKATTTPATIRNEPSKLDT